MPRIERALLSVTDKTGIIHFAKTLHLMGVELISTGGTAKMLTAEGIPVREVSDVTGFPEMLDGRVKTLHPCIAAGILAVRAKPDHMAALKDHNIPPIQMVVVNLYQFEKFANRAGITREELIENIDIGGPTMIRAGAKNFQDVAVVVSPSQYESILSELEGNAGALSLDTHWCLAQQAFSHTAAYDHAVSTRLLKIDTEGQDIPQEVLPSNLRVAAARTTTLRYGENPHQHAGLYSFCEGGVASAQQLHGKELSYNNLVDLDAAWLLASEFKSPAAIIVKHTNPCGCAEQSTLPEAYRKALEADPISAYGGVLAFNRELDAETAHEVAGIFTEAIAAPSFSAGALSILQAKKNLRLVKVPPLSKEELVLKSITGGILAQTPDAGTLDPAKLEVKTERAPTEDEIGALTFGWTVCKHVKSNAVVYSRNGQIVSTGAGQMSRVDSVKFGALKAILPLYGTVLASDAYFPFADGIEEAAKHGITAVIQPGGSIRDSDVIAAANRLGLAMVFTGIRHFRH
ncbi:MAG: bifunctional phosphoribosylaminoimidazolecarboxamide formyltransferase/IMP cyclohydrolase [Bryobacteraceae bacterium]